MRVRWHGLARDAGWYQLIALDKRVTPPRPLPTFDGWNTEGATGSNWASAYNELSKHYDWLAGTASVQGPDGSWSDPGQAVHAPATEAGMVTGVFLLPPDRLPFTDVATEVLVALFYVADGEVRWARRVAG